MFGKYGEDSYWHIYHKDKITTIQRKSDWSIDYFKNGHKNNKTYDRVSNFHKFYF